MSNDRAIFGDKEKRISFAYLLDGRIMTPERAMEYLTNNFSLQRGAASTYLGNLILKEMGL